jgi:tyrosine-protein kinase Etk/Wzc
VNRNFIPAAVNSEKQQYYLVLRDVKSAANAVIGALNVAVATKQSSLIALRFTDPIRERTEDVLNDIIREYNQEGINDKNLISAKTLEFLGKRLVLVARELSSVEGEYQEYRSREGIVNLGDEGRAFLSNIQASDQKMSDLQIQLDILNQIEKYVVKKGQHPGTVPATLGAVDQLFNVLLEKLYSFELDLERLKQTNGDNSPAVIAEEQQITQVKASLLENISSARQSMTARLNAIKQDNSKNSGLLKTVPKKERDLLQISRTQTIKNNIYTFLLQKREETELSSASAVADSRIVNSAESGWAPVKPIPLNIYLIALTVGIFAGVIFVLIREQYNQAVLFRGEIERITNAPILGEVSYDESGETLAIKDGKRTIIAEQFRALRTSLSYIGVRDKSNTILLTSSISGEGKSFMGINLAVSLALTGKKVALLEFDLRKPKVSRMLDISQEPGISNYMAGLNIV